MSSHREAPEISKDPVADSTDVYAFMSPDRPGTVTLIANYIPLEGPAGGPNFYAFGDDVLYEIHVDNNGDAEPDVTFQFRFQTTLANQNTFLYNTGPVLSLNSPNLNSRQTYSVTRVKGGTSAVLAEGLMCPPCNIGPLSTPNYAALAATDPANPYGAALAWPDPWVPAGEQPRHRPGRKAGALVVLVDGAPALYVERGGRTTLTFTTDPAVLAAAAGALGDAVRTGRTGRLTIDKVDGVPVLGGALHGGLGTALVAAGFTPTPSGLRLRAQP